MDMARDVFREYRDHRSETCLYIVVGGDTIPEIKA
jgi:hypothetical protein